MSLPRFELGTPASLRQIQVKLILLDQTHIRAVLYQAELQAHYDLKINKEYLKVLILSNKEIKIFEESKKWF